MTSYLTQYSVTDSFESIMLLAFVVFIAGIVRGAIGFGFSAIVVATASLWLAPADMVSMVVLLEIIASLIMLKSIQSDIHYPTLKPLVLGSLPTIFIGVLLLTSINGDVLRIIMGAYLVGIVLVSWFNPTFNYTVSWLGLILIGLGAGLLNGLSAMGGIFIATALVCFSFPIAKVRSTMVVYFLLCELIFLVAGWMNDLYTPAIFITTFMVVPAMFIGIALGTRLFQSANEATLKKMVLIALFAIAAVGLVKTLSVSY